MRSSFTGARQESRPHPIAPGGTTNLTPDQPSPPFPDAAHRPAARTIRLALSLAAIVLLVLMPSVALVRPPPATPPAAPASSPASPTPLQQAVLLLRDDRTPADHQAGFALLSQAAATGDADTLTLLADLYAAGKGTTADIAKALQLYRKAAPRNAKAAYALAVAYRDGLDFLPADKRKSFEWFERSAAAGHVEAMLQAGVACEEGRGTDRSEARAARWYQSAFTAGSTEAAWRLSSFLYRTERVFVGLWAGSPARYYVRYAATAGHPDARAFFRQHEPPLLDRRLRYADSLRPCMDKVAEIARALESGADANQYHQLLTAARESFPYATNPRTYTYDEFHFYATLVDTLKPFLWNRDHGSGPVAVPVDLHTPLSLSDGDDDAIAADKVRHRTIAHLRRLLTRYAALRATLEEDRNLTAP